MKTALTLFDLPVEDPRPLALGVAYLAIAEALAAAPDLPQASLNRVTAVEQSTPAAYFEAALNHLSQSHDRQDGLIAYGRYLLEQGERDKALISLNEARSLASKAENQYNLAQIESILLPWHSPLQK